MSVLPFSVKRATTLHLCSVCLVVSLASAPALAQQVDTVPAAIAPIDLPEATVRADQLPRTLLTTPAAITRISTRELRTRDLALTPTEVLSRVPGVYMQEGGLGTHRIVLRGQGARAPFTTNRVRAYLGAIPLTDGEGNTDLEDIDLSLLESIDVIRGPAATTYGSGLGGVILLTPDFSAPAGFSASGEAMAGSFGTYRVGTHVNFGSDQLQARAGYQRTQSDGFRQNSRYRRDNAVVLLRLKPSSDGAIAEPRGHTDVQLLYTGVRNEIASSLGATALAEDRTQAGGTWGDSEGFESYDRLSFGVSRTQALGQRGRLEASTFLKSRRAYEPRPFNILRENSLATGGRLLLGFRQGDFLSASVGGELFRDWYDSEIFVNRYQDFPAGTGSIRGNLLNAQSQVRTQLNAFAQTDLGLGAILGLNHPDQLDLTLGLAVNRTRYALDDLLQPDSLRATPTESYAYPTQVSPRIALRYRIAPRWSAFGQVARGFSPPSVAETLAPDGSINPDIRPETGWNYELGLRGVAADGRWHIDAVAYILQSEDLLVARRTAEDAFVGVNAGRSHHPGVELAGDYTVGAQRGAAGLSARVYGSYTLQAHRFDEFVDGDADYSGNALTGVPGHQGSAGVDAGWGPHWAGHLGLRAVGELPVNDANTAYAEGYATVSARVSRTLGRVQLSLGADNLLDAEYTSMVSVNAGGFGGREPRYFYPGRPRTVWVGLRLAARD